MGEFKVSIIVYDYSIPVDPVMCLKILLSFQRCLDSKTNNISKNRLEKMSSSNYFTDFPFKFLQIQANESDC